MNPFSVAWYKEQCEQLRIYPEKQRGQNFLIDQSIPKKMIEAAQLSKKDTVIEIGPGFGPLTYALANTLATIHVFDIEQKFSRTPIMKELIDRKRITFHHQDIVDAEETSFPQGYTVISNLPYSVSSAVLIKFLTSPHPPSRMILMLQKEVVEKLLAKPPNMTRLSVLTQATSMPKKICAVPRSAFWPQPSVESVVVHMRDITQPKHFDALQMLTRIGFASKRKKLINNLKCLTLEAHDLLKQAGINPDARAQELSVMDWVRLAEKLQKM